MITRIMTNFIESFSNVLQTKYRLIFKANKSIQNELLNDFKSAHQQFMDFFYLVAGEILISTAVKNPKVPKIS